MKILNELKEYLAKERIELEEELKTLHNRDSKGGAHILGSISSIKKIENFLDNNKQ